MLHRCDGDSSGESRCAHADLALLPIPLRIRRGVKNGCTAFEDEGVLAPGGDGNEDAESVFEELGAGMVVEVVTLTEAKGEW